MLKSKAVVATFLVAFFAASGSAMAQDKDTKWEKHHPRREQVNERLENQNKRINEERKEGEITKAQARKLHREDHQIRQEERDMASQNGGHITKSEQRVLNQQENALPKAVLYPPVKQASQLASSRLMNRAADPSCRSAAILKASLQGWTHSNLRWHRIHPDQCAFDRHS